jgi:hypothetical protein
MTVCAHGPCTCEAAEGADHCSDWCAAHEDEHDECHCHHQGCAAPHHH